jgi:hypothetical protein
MWSTRQPHPPSRRLQRPFDRTHPNAFWEALELRTLFSAAFDVTGLTQLRADPAFAGVDGSDLSVAVLDTGLFASHPDIQDNFLRFFDAVGNGQNALSDPGTAVASQAFDPAGEGHGTHVAGTVGSTNPEIGVATGTNLIGVRALLSEGDSQPQVNPLVAGLQWVLTNHDDYNIRVVNMSLGSNTNFNNVPNKDDVGRLIDQLEDRGVTVVAASGNSYGGFASLGTAYPSIFSTIAVANTWEDAGTAQERGQITLGQGNGGLFGVIDADPQADQLSASSQRSTLGNQVAAPGTTIFSTWNGDDGLLYNTIAGTSMASPFVAGSVALMQDAAFTFGGRYLTTTEVLAIVRETADDVVDAQNPDTSRFPVGRNSSGQLVQTGPVQDLPESDQTFKRINVYRALQRVRDFITGGTNPAPNPDPVLRTEDTNNVREAATNIPSLTGLEAFEFVANIGTDGDVNVGADDVDLYRVTLASPGFPVFAVAAAQGGTAFNAYARLFNAEGTQIAAQDNTGSSQYPTLDTRTSLGSPLAAGTYYFGVSAAPNTSYNIANGTGVAQGSSTGDYRVTVSLSNPDPNGVAQGAFQLDLTNPDVIKNGSTTAANLVLGTIGSDPNPLTANGDPRINVGATDVDFFAVTAPDTGRLTVDVDAFSAGLTDAVDSYLAIFDESLNPIGTNDDQAEGVLDSLLTVNVTQGARYFVALTTFQNRSFNPANPFDRMSSNPNAVGSYEAYFSFDNGDANGTVNDAAAFTAADPDGDGRVLGEIGADLGAPLLSEPTNNGNKDVDYFTFAPTQPGLLQIEVTGDDGFDAVIGLWTIDEQGQLVAVGDTNDAPSAIGVEIGEGLVGNDLFVSVTGAGNQGFNPFAVGSGNGGETGTYTLAITQRTEQEFRGLTNNSIQNHTPEPVAVGEPLRRDVGRDGTIDVGSDDIDIYRFDSPFNGVLTVRTDTSTESSADTVLRLFNAAGEELAANNNASGATTASEASITVIAGQTYFIGVNGASDDARLYNPLTGEGAAEGSEGEYGLLLEATESDLPTVTVSDVTVTEVVGADAQAVFTLTLSEPGAGTPTVNVTTADATATAGDDYDPRSVTVAFPNGATTATVAVNVTGDFDEESAETFTVNLSGGSGLLIADNRGVATIQNTTAPPPTPFAGAAQPLTFTPAGGAPVTLSLKGPGTGSAFFAPGAASPGRIVLEGTTGATALTIKGDAALPDLVVNGSLKSLGTKTTDLTGDLTVTGNVPKITLDAVTDGTITVAGSTPLTVALGVVNGLTFNSTAPIKSMKVAAWNPSDAVDDVLTTPQLLSLAVRGRMAGSIRAGAIGKVTVGGALDAAEVRAEQSIAALTAGTIVTTRVFAGVAAGLADLPDAAADFANPAARIGAVTVKDRGPLAFVSALVAAPSLGKLKLGTASAPASQPAPGVAGDTIQSLAASAGGESLKLSKLDDPAGSRTVGELVLRLL